MSCKSATCAHTYIQPHVMRVVEKVWEGKANKIIAFELNLVEGSVKQYITKALEILKFDNRLQLALWYERTIVPKLHKQQSLDFEEIKDASR